MCHLHNCKTKQKVEKFNLLKTNFCVFLFVLEYIDPITEFHRQPTNYFDHDSFAQETAQNGNDQIVSFHGQKRANSSW